MPHYGDQILMAAGFDAQHTKAAALVMEGDPLDQSTEQFIGGFLLLALRFSHLEKTLDAADLR